MGSDKCLEVARGSLADSLVGQYQRLESNVSDYRKPVEVAEEGGTCESGGYIARCVLDLLEGFH